MTNSTERSTVVVAVCTFNRNGPLTSLLEALMRCASHSRTVAKIGVVVVDDSIDGRAQPVAEKYRDSFELGIVYERSGQQNISLARNLAIELASQMADWTAMIDDDCEPVSEWLSALLDVQARTGAGAVTGPMVRRVPSNSPNWLREQPFLELGLDQPSDGSEMKIGSTFNSMISSKWLRDHPTIRFSPSLGQIGGEDMVFYRAAHAAGLRIFYSKRALVYENEPPRAVHPFLSASRSFLAR